jgi:hypothetical protein
MDQGLQFRKCGETGGSAFPDAVAAPEGACALRGRRRLINLVSFPAQNLNQFAVAVDAALIRTANPRRLVRPSANVL